LIPEEFYPAIKESYHGGSCSMFIRGYIKMRMIFAIDINSSYPGQMWAYLFPTGPYYKIDMLNIKYEG